MESLASFLILWTFGFVQCSQNKKSWFMCIHSAFCLGSQYSFYSECSSFPISVCGSINYETQTPQECVLIAIMTTIHSYSPWVTLVFSYLDGCLLTMTLWDASIFPILLMRKSGPKDIYQFAQGQIPCNGRREGHKTVNKQVSSVSV